jgi:ABC-type phosphate/phosphonate transport system substrate-binding protein
MIASLGMYDFGPATAANNRLWALVRDGLRHRGLPAPDALTAGEDAFWPAWENPDLVLSQTCGYPFRARLHGRVALIGAGDHRLPGCSPGTYRSVFVVRISDPRQGLDAFTGADFAWNEDLSQSGWAAPITHLSALGIKVRPAIRTGGHRSSALAVAEGRADIASLDAVTWRLMQGTDPVAARLRIVAETEPTPALPFIAAAGADGPSTFSVLATAIGALSPGDQAALSLYGLVAPAAADYLAIASPPDPAAYAASL